MTTTTTNTKRLVVVVGPTGSGKTDLAIALAQHYGAPIVSTDSRQFYRGMPIGTAQPTAQQLRAAEHHFIASHDITQELNCGAYEVEALALLDRLFEQHRTVIAVGGSGLYIKALCEGMDELPQADPELRAALAEQLREEGVAALAERLRSTRSTTSRSTAATPRGWCGRWRSACRRGAPSRSCASGGAASVRSTS